MRKWRLAEFMEIITALLAALVVTVTVTWATPTAGPADADYTVDSAYDLLANILTEMNRQGGIAGAGAK
jgi:hypothetical protein